MDIVSLLIFATEVVANHNKRIKNNPDHAKSATFAGEQHAMRQLEICKEMIHTNNSLAHPFLDSELKFMMDTLVEIQSSMHLDIAQSLRRVVHTGHVPKSLLMTHAPGCLTYDEVGAKVEFQVRANNYLTTTKKVISESALFFERSIQIIHSDQFYTHVARYPWCALPRTEPNNLFFILNYILPGTPRIHVICIYVATAETLSVVLEAQATFQRHISAVAAGTATAATSATGGGRHHRHHVHLYPSDSEQWAGWKGLVARMFVGHSAANTHNNPSSTHHHHHHHHHTPAAEADNNLLPDTNATTNSNKSSDVSSRHGTVTPNNSHMTSSKSAEVVSGDDSDDSQESHNSQDSANSNGSSSGSSSSSSSSVSSGQGEFVPEDHPGEMAPPPPPTPPTPPLAPSYSNGLNLAASEVETEFINRRLKLIPTMVEANWAVKMAVGQRPAILGTKIPLRYFKGRNYLEVDIDLSTSTIATGIMGMVTGLSKNMVVDLGWTLQGEKAEELPERILAQTRFNHVDLEAGAEVD